MTGFKVPNRSALVRWRGSLDGLLPGDHLARFIWNILCSLNFGEFEGTYPSVRTGQGRPPYHPRLLAALWIYGITQGFETASGIAHACEVRDDFKWLAGGLTPCDQTLLNFLTRALELLPALWVQILLAMQEAGFIDLSLVAEDGTKVRVNASPGSFRTLDKINAVVGVLSSRLEGRLKEIAERSAEATNRRTATEIAGMRGRLARAARAKEVVEDRIRRRRTREPAHSSLADQDSGHPEGPDSDRASAIKSSQKSPRFDRSHFRQDPDSEGLLCPGEQKLRYIGEYSYADTRSGFRLYGRRDCSDCPQKNRCTGGAGRRVKVPLVTAENAGTSPEPQSNTDGSACGSKHAKAADDGPEPTASLTEPDSKWMLTTSRKRWEPAFNADIAVTRDGIIVSQFLSTENNDFHFFKPALRFVQATLGKPEAWVGDGHYSTEANIVLASREGVVLYAPRPGPRASNATHDDVQKPTPSRKERGEAKFQSADFKSHPEKEALICPANEELRFIGEYATDSQHDTYRLYRRRDCSGCQLRERCTSGRGRSVKVIDRESRAQTPSSPSTAENGALDDADMPAVAEILRAHDARMESIGKKLTILRGHTSEPANAHLHLHGLGRFHVRGFDRCGVVLTLSCMAHNMRKWAMKVATERILLAS